MGRIKIECPIDGNTETADSEISKALDSAVVRTCDACNGSVMSVSGEYMAVTGKVDSREVRQMLDIWWRFNLLSGRDYGDPNAFIYGHSFEASGD